MEVRQCKVCEDPIAPGAPVCNECGCSHACSSCAAEWLHRSNQTCVVCRQDSSGFAGIWASRGRLIRRRRLAYEAEAREHEYYLRVLRRGRPGWMPRATPHERTAELVEAPSGVQSGGDEHCLTTMLDRAANLWRWLTRPAPTDDVRPTRGQSLVITVYV